MARKRQFRSEESFAAEKRTRDMLEPFLLAHSFRDVDDQRRKYGRAESQTIFALAPDGQRVGMRVRQCWRWEGRNKRERTYSAAQLTARVEDGDWLRTLERLVGRDRDAGATHQLFVQASRDRVERAALVPLDALVPIWCAQRDVSDRLIREGQLGGRHKNHAMNGSSPTIWLQDDRAPEVADQLWRYMGVVDLVAMHLIGRSAARDDVATVHFPDDTLDDLPGLPMAVLGSDAGQRLQVVRSHVKRDQRVRDVVLRRARNTCERSGCGQTRSWPGFLDVHHILGVDFSDRVWTCVALCPNCHREAHFAGDREHFNAELAEFASRFQMQP